MKLLALLLLTIAAAHGAMEQPGQKLQVALNIDLSKVTGILAAKTPPMGTNLTPKGVKPELPAGPVVMVVPFADRTGGGATGSKLTSVYFPTDFDRPEIIKNPAAPKQMPTVIPWFPNNFSTTDVGWKFAVKAEPEESGDLIQVDLTVSYTDASPADSSFGEFGGPIYQTDPKTGKKWLATQNQKPTLLKKTSEATLRLLVKPGTVYPLLLPQGDKTVPGTMTCKLVP